MNLHDLPISPQRQASLFAAGMLTILTLGTLASFAVVLTALWLLVQFVALLFQSMIEVLSSVGTTYQAADPLIRFLILVATGYSLYRLVRRYAPATWRLFS